MKFILIICLALTFACDATSGDTTESTPHPPDPAQPTGPYSTLEFNDNRKTFPLRLSNCDVEPDTFDYTPVWLDPEHLLIGDKHGLSVHDFSSDEPAIIWQDASVPVKSLERMGDYVVVGSFYNEHRPLPGSKSETIPSFAGALNVFDVSNPKAPERVYEETAKPWTMVRVNESQLWVLFRSEARLYSFSEGEFEVSARLPAPNSSPYSALTDGNLLMLFNDEDTQIWDVSDLAAPRHLGAVSTDFAWPIQILDRTTHVTIVTQTSVVDLSVSDLTEKATHMFGAIRASWLEGDVLYIYDDKNPGQLTTFELTEQMSPPMAVPYPNEVESSRRLGRFILNSEFNPIADTGYLVVRDQSGELPPQIIDTNHEAMEVFQHEHDEFTVGIRPRRADPSGLTLEETQTTVLYAVRNGTFSRLGKIIGSVKTLYASADHAFNLHHFRQSSSMNAYSLEGPVRLLWRKPLPYTTSRLQKVGDLVIRDKIQRPYNSPRRDVFLAGEPPTTAESVDLPQPFPLTGWGFLSGGAEQTLNTLDWRAEDPVLFQIQYRTKQFDTFEIQIPNDVTFDPDQQNNPTNLFVLNGFVALERDKKGEGYEFLLLEAIEDSNVKILRTPETEETVRALPYDGGLLVVTKTVFERVDEFTRTEYLAREITTAGGPSLSGALSIQGYPIWYDGEVLVTLEYTQSESGLTDAAVTRMRRTPEGFAIESRRVFPNRTFVGSLVDENYVYLTHMIDDDYRRSESLPVNCEGCANRLTLLENGPGLTRFSDGPISAALGLEVAGGDRVLMCDSAGRLVFDVSSPSEPLLHSYYPGYRKPYFDGSDWWLIGQLSQNIDDGEDNLNRIQLVP